MVEAQETTAIDWKKRQYKPQKIFHGKNHKAYEQIAQKGCEGFS